MESNIFEKIEWSAEIGDPTLMGWLTVAAYFLTAFLTLRVGYRAQHLFSQDTVKAQKWFWFLISVVITILGINKQLDLQSLLTALGKYYALRDGWYQDRRAIQVIGIGGIICFLLISMFTFMYYFRKILKFNWLAMIGLFFLVCFIIIRATSFHHVDIFLSSWFYGVKLNWLLELSGIAAIAFSAIFIQFSNKYSQQR